MLAQGRHLSGLFVIFYELDDRSQQCDDIVRRGKHVSDIYIKMHFKKAVPFLKLLKFKSYKEATDFLKNNKIPVASIITVKFHLAI